ncbi:putative chromatin regulator PHD family [Helianthus annuus]|nr:putative chromatin regulator PHD family [Helianthus annuus]
MCLKLFICQFNFPYQFNIQKIYYSPLNWYTPIHPATQLTCTTFKRKCINVLDKHSPFRYRIDDVVLPLLKHQLTSPIILLFPKLPPINHHISQIPHFPQSISTRLGFLHFTQLSTDDLISTHFQLISTMELRNSRVEGPAVDQSQPIAQVVAKRKRGRPPRAQPVAKKSKEEDEDEDVCFICFDGGSLVLCDRRGCPKAYHPACIKRDEAFFRSKAKWNCGWHICSMCEKTAHHMCYTCTYSLCKGCVRTSDYVCVRGDKGFCTVCMKTIMLIENSGDATVDFDDKTSWEYLFKVYWLYTKGKLSLTLDELTQAKNPWKLASIEPTTSHISASGRRSITADLSKASLEANEAKRRKTNEQTNGLPNDLSTDVPKEWASKELLEFVAHMKNGDTSVLSQFDVQALLLEYIKRNNLRDPRKNTQIVCDLRLMNLFGKPRVGHIEMLKLLEPHFLVKENTPNDTPDSTAKPANTITDCKTENTAVVSNKERRNHRKGGKRIQNKLDEYAAIDVHNMSLIYLRRNLMQSLVEDNEKFNEKAVGSIVQIRISGSDQKDDMYRLVQVVGTTKVDVPYKIGDKLVDVMLEVSNLDKKETVSIDTISNQELSEDECRRLRESIRCGLVRCFTVGEIQEKAMALQSVLIDDKIGAEMLRLNQLRDRASEKGQKKGVRECVQKLKILKTPEERERRLREIPVVHSDPKMNPDYESDDTEEYFNNEQEHRKPKFPWVSGTNTISPTKKADSLKDQPVDLHVANVDEDSKKPNTGNDAIVLSSSASPQNEAQCNGSIVPKCDPEAALTSSLSNIASDPAPSIPSLMNNRSVDDDMWHYRDPSGNVQGPFSLLQLQKWNTSGYFPADMRIWADLEADSLLLNNVLQEHFHNPDGQRPENVASNVKDNQVDSVTVCSEAPSSTVRATSYAFDNSVNLERMPEAPSSTVRATSYGLDNSVNLEKMPEAPSSTVRATSYGLDNSVNLEKMPEAPSSTVRATSYALDNSVNLEKMPEAPSSTVRATSYALDNSVNLEKMPDDLNCDPDPPSVGSLTKMNESTTTEQFGIQNMPDINQHVSSVFTVADAPLVDLPTSLLKKESHDNPKIQDSRDKQPSNFFVQDSGIQKMPDINQQVSSVFTVANAALVDLPSPLPKKESHENPKIQDSGNPPSWSTTLSLVVGGTQLPETGDEWGRYSTTVDHPTNSTIDQITNMPSWHGLSETIEFSTLAEESVSDLLAEVDAMESRNCVPSPTSRRNSFLEDLFNGSIDDFSPTADQGTRSDGFSSTADIHLSRQSTGLQFSFGLETKPTCAVSIPQTSVSDNISFKWAEMGSSELHPPHPPRQDMIDLNDSTRAEADDGERETVIEEKSTTRPVVNAETRVGRKSKEKERESTKSIKQEIFEAKIVHGFSVVAEEEGEFVQPDMAAPPPPPPPSQLPPLLPLPPQPAMGLDTVDSRRAGSGRPSQGTTTTGRVHAHTSSSRSGNVGRDSHHRRSGGDRYYSNSNSPRERSHHVEDSGYSRSSKASWSRQSSFGGGSSGGGGGGGSGYSRPPLKGQRVCKFYESGRCKKGSACNYLHPQDSMMMMMLAPACDSVYHILAIGYWD